MLKTFFRAYKWDISFWTVQLLSWGGLIFIAYAFTPNIEGYKQGKVFFYSLVATFIIGLVTTGILRGYLKRILNFDNFDSRQVVKIMAAILIVSLLYFGMSYAFLYVI